jgi:hypothetical protein
MHGVLRPIPVLFVAPYGGMGGSENVLVNLLERLDGRFAPRVLVMEEGVLRDRVAALGVPVEVAHMPGKQGVLAIPRVARSFRGPAAVIHANGGKAAVLGLALRRRLRAPLLWMKHDHNYDGHASRLLASRCDHVVSVSYAMAEQFRFLGSRSSVVYPGVITRDLPDVSATAPVIVSVGRLDPFKGFEELLRATALLRGGPGQQASRERCAGGGRAARHHGGHGRRATGRRHRPAWNPRGDRGLRLARPVAQRGGFRRGIAAVSGGPAACRAHRRPWTSEGGG